MMQTKDIIRKWYKVLAFPPKYDAAFYAALDEIEIDANMTVEAYDIHTPHGMQNLLYCLYFCETTKKRYAKKGIGEAILMDTLADLPRWLEIDTNKNGTPGIENMDWLHHHLELKLFKLGRLQYCFGKKVEIAEVGVHKEDTVLGIHIPEAGPLLQEECIQSLDMARAFYAKFFPEIQWAYFTCRSWLLGKPFAEMLGVESNISKFQKLFCITEQFESDSVISYVFGWGLKRADRAKFTANSRFAKKLLEQMEQGAVFYGGLGYIQR